MLGPPAAVLASGVEGLIHITEMTWSRRLKHPSKVVKPGDQVEATARELAQRIAAGPTRSLGISKQMYRRSLTNSMETMFYEEADATALVTQTTPPG